MEQFEKLLNHNVPTDDSLLECFKFLYAHNRKISLDEILPWFSPVYHEQIKTWWHLTEQNHFPKTVALIKKSQENECDLSAMVFQHLIDFNTRLHEIEALIHVLRIKNMNARKQLITLKNKEYFE